jgi:hypothetical protein
MQVKLTKIESTHNNVRTTEVVGELAFWPEVGDRIALLGDPLSPLADARVVITSPVQRIEGDLFYTLNSIYRLARADDVHQ